MDVIIEKNQGHNTTYIEQKHWTKLLWQTYNFKVYVMLTLTLGNRIDLYCVLLAKLPNLYVVTKSINKVTHGKFINTWILME